MLKLDPRRRAFVHALVLTGATQAQAAEMAGYNSRGKWRKKYLEKQGCVLAHHPDVLAAIHEEGLKLLRATSPLALRVLREIAANKEEASRDRIAAAKELLSRGGFAAVTEQHHTVDVRVSVEQKKARIKELAAKLKLSPDTTAQFLGETGAPVDAEFRELPAPVREPAPQPVPAGENAPSRKGIEDLLGLEPDDHPEDGDLDD
jgi:phage terminase small subunit